ncbi:MAG: helix-turn-helix domain-containing protein [Clostridia bacterium]|nr:helix-turn-helix domain-containing protein [Clostridia bacterium]
MSFSQKVLALLKENGMTKAALAKESGIPYTTLDSMLKRDSDTARLATVFRIARALGTSVEDLVFDEGGGDGVSPDEKRVLDLYTLLDDRGKDTVLSLLEREAGHSREGLRSFPVYDSPAAAGRGEPVFSEEKTFLPVREGEIPAGADFGVRITGDSMEPLFSEGDIAYVKRGAEIRSGEIGVFLLNGESYCKKYSLENGVVSLVSLNPAYEPIRVLETDEIRLVGKVIQ